MSYSAEVAGHATPGANRQRNVAVVTLADVRAALVRPELPLDDVLRRDLRSALDRLAKMADSDLTAVPATAEALRELFAGINRAAFDIKKKTFANIRSSAFKAIDVAIPHAVVRSVSEALTPEWEEICNRIRADEDNADKVWSKGLNARKVLNGASRLMRFASARGVAPAAVDEALFLAFREFLIRSSNARDPAAVYRNTLAIWKALRMTEGYLDLGFVTLDPEKHVWTGVKFHEMSPEFQADWNAYFARISVVNIFDDDAPAKALAPKTLQLRSRQLLSALTALRDAGVNLSTVKSLADLVTLEGFKAIVRQRIATQGEGKKYEHELTTFLIAVARDWVRADLMGWTAPAPGICVPNCGRC